MQKHKLTLVLDVKEALSDADIAELTAQMEQALGSLWKVKSVQYTWAKKTG